MDHHVKVVVNVYTAKEAAELAGRSEVQASLYGMLPGLYGARDFQQSHGHLRPIAAFIASGLDHVVANIFFVPTAIVLHTNDITVGLYNWESMIPAVICTIVGGSLFVGVVCWYLHLAGGDAVSVHGVSFEGDAPFDECSAQPSGVEGLKHEYGSPA